MEQNIIKIAIIEDDDETRDLLEKLIKREPDMECVGTFRDAEDMTLSRLKARQPHVVFMDISLKEQGTNRQLRNGIEAMTLLKDDETMNDTKFLIWTDFADIVNIFNAFLKQADGFIQKQLGWSDIIHDIKRVHKGEYIMPKIIQTRIVELLKSPPKIVHELSNDQKQILKYRAEGMTYTEIAVQLDCTEHNIKYHLRQIRKLIEAQKEKPNMLFLNLLLDVLGVK
jgi:DNA-binding NarL/FixJ family response regulator